MFQNDITECRTRVGFTWQRLKDAALLWSNLSDNADGVKIAAYHMAVTMESIEEEALPWMFPQAMSYLAALAINSRIYRHQSRHYGIVEHSRDDTYMLFASACSTEKLNLTMTPESLNIRLLVHLMGMHHPHYTKVLYSLSSMITNGDDSTRPHTPLKVIRKTTLQNVDFIRASRYITENALQSHAALCYSLGQYH